MRYTSLIGKVLTNKFLTDKAGIPPVSTVGQSRQAGFTLMEVLIALVIIALVGVVLAQTTSQSVNQVDYLKRKLIGTWVAENRLAEFSLQSQSGQTIDLAEQEVEQSNWRWRTQASLEKQASGVARIEIQVFQPPTAESPLFSLTGYLPVASSTKAVPQ